MYQNNYNIIESENKRKKEKVQEKAIVTKFSVQKINATKYVKKIDTYKNLIYNVKCELNIKEVFICVKIIVT